MPKESRIPWTLLNITFHWTQTENHPLVSRKCSTFYLPSKHDLITPHVFTCNTKNFHYIKNIYIVLFLELLLLLFIFIIHIGISWHVTIYGENCFSLDISMFFLILSLWVHRSTHKCQLIPWYTEQKGEPVLNASQFCQSNCMTCAFSRSERG